MPKTGLLATCTGLALAAVSCTEMRSSSLVKSDAGGTDTLPATGGAGGQSGGAGRTGTGGVAAGGTGGGAAGGAAGGTGGVATGGTGGGATGGTGGGATGGAGGGATGGTGGVTTAGSVAFPLVHSANGRFLQDQNGVPFPILGRASWFAVSLSATDFQTYIADTVSRGFDAIEVTVMGHDSRGNNPPHDGNGDLPFTKRLDGGTWSGSLTYSNINNEAPDFSTPNEAYWAFVDNFLSYCQSQGILVLMFPAYAGFQGGPQGWMAELVANGPTKLTTYGTYIANRYKNQPNIVWMAGGDQGTGTGADGFSAAQSAAENGLLTGLRSVAGQKSVDFSAEWSTESIGTDQTTFGSLMTLNSTYSFMGNVPTEGRRAYGFTTVHPAFLLEEPYDEEGPDGLNYNPNATQPVRRFDWWGYLSTIGGYMAGNGYVWPFVAPAWRNHLNTQGSRDLSQLNAFVRSINWSDLVPSGLGSMKTLVTAGGGSPSDTGYVTAAATSAGTLLVAYVPPAHSGTITVDLTALHATTRARWFNPTTAAYTMIGSYPNTGTQVFTPPGDNGTGSSDWVLVVDTP